MEIMAFGRVTDYYSVDGTGKICIEMPPDKRGEEAFFLRATYHGGKKSLERRPKVGDRLVFWINKDVKVGRPQARRWSFEDEKCAMKLRHIPFIGRNEFKEGDLEVWESSKTWGDNPICWTVVVYRPSTDEYFQITCRDGERGGYITPLPTGELPDGIMILED